LQVKASDVDRLLSVQSLTAALGPYQPPGELAREQSAEVAYDPGTPKRSGALYEAFRTERDGALRERAVALAALSLQHRTYAEQLRAWYRERVRQERASGLAGAFRRDALRHLREKQREDRTTRIRREAKERHDLRAIYRIPVWPGWLEVEAARGNEAALAALRSRARRREVVATQLLAAESADEARHVIRGHLRPAIRRDGRVIYQLSDGGAVSDEARQVRVSQVTDGAVFFALSLASERFGPRPLVVKGTEEFCRQVAVLAGQKELAVTFADPKLEAHRVIAGFEHARADEHGHDRDNGLSR
jgi:hypothetical protein